MKIIQTDKYAFIYTVSSEQGSIYLENLPVQE